MKVKVHIMKLEALVATTCVINYIMNLCNLNDKNQLIPCQLATKRYLSIAVSDSKCTALIEIILKTQKISYQSTHSHSRLKQSTLVLMCGVPWNITADNEANITRRAKLRVKTHLSKKPKLELSLKVHAINNVICNLTH